MIRGSCKIRGSGSGQTSECNNPGQQAEIQNTQVPNQNSAQPDTSKKQRTVNTIVIGKPNQAENHENHVLPPTHERLAVSRGQSPKSQEPTASGRYKDNVLNISYINICGLKSKLLSPEFEHFLNSYDILALGETKTCER